MRSLFQRLTTIACACLLATLLSPGAAQARRPVVAPGQQVPNKPPPPPEVSAPEAREETGAAAGAAEEPAAPAVPLDFADVQQVTAPAAPAEEVEAPADLGPHRELRSTRLVGDFVYVTHVRPGEPVPGAPIELFFRINEILPIPDPLLGDRRPLEGGKLAVRVRGNGMDRTIRVHELSDKGTYGAHFSVDAAGVYDLEVERTDGRVRQKLDLRLGVGTPTPGVETAAQGPRPRGRAGVVEGLEMVAVAGPDDSRIGGVMDELGRRWMELDRVAGTEEAAAALEAVREQAQLVAGKMPQVHGANAPEFDRLAAQLVERVQGLEAEGADGRALRGTMQRVQEESCMRCHAKYRHQFAADVQTWPDFAVREKLEPPTSGTSRSTRSRTPFRAQ